MVSFRSLIAGAALIAVPVMAAISAVDVQRTLHKLEGKVAALEEIAWSITEDDVDDWLSSAGMGSISDLAEGLSEIATSVEIARDALNGSQPILHGKETDRVGIAVLEFVNHNRRLIDALAYTIYLFETAPGDITSPFVKALNHIESASQMIHLILDELINPSGGPETLPMLAKRVYDFFSFTIQAFEALKPPGRVKGKTAMHSRRCQS